MPFRDTNAALGLARSSRVTAGRADTDDGNVTEQNTLIPWSSDSAASYIYYDCTIGVMLDSGIVVHNRLPQVDRLADTLSSADMGAANFEQIKNMGVNLKCNDQYADIVQRMGHSRYWFRLWGQALRAGYQVPIPGVKTIGGVAAVPYDKNPQWAFNRIFPGGNYSGVIMWHAAWSLWYTTAVPPVSQDIPAVDPSAHIDGSIAPPSRVQSPYSQTDDNAVPLDIKAIARR